MRGEGWVDLATAASPAALEQTPGSQGLRVAMALYGDITFDSRVQREAASLSQAGHSVTVYCLQGDPPVGAPFATVVRAPQRSDVLPDGSSPFLHGGRGGFVARLLDRIRWMEGYLRNLRAWGRWAVADAGEVDVWHVHDLTALMAIGPFLPKRSRLVYDSHEIFVETGTAVRLPGPMRRILSRYERHLVSKADALVTVNEGYAEVLGRRTRPRTIVLVRNCPPRWQDPRADRKPLRSTLGIEAEAPIAMYHGVLTRHRGIEELIEALAVPSMSRVHAVILGYGPLRDELRAAAGEERYGGRLHVMDAVPPSELLAAIADVDVDVIALQRSTLNHYLCTPNKLWESIAAGVPVVVSDFPVMRDVVMSEPAGPLGGVCDPSDPRSIAAAVAMIVDAPAADRSAMRERCRTAAEARWNWETESRRLIDLYDELGRSIRQSRSPSASPASVPAS